MAAYKKGDVRRRVRALELRLAGATQAQAAAAVGITERMVRRYESDLRRGRSPALSSVSAALAQEFREEDRSRARARILCSLADLAVQASKESLARIKLEQLRAAPLEPAEPATVHAAPAGSGSRACPRRGPGAPRLTPEGLALIEGLLAQAAANAENE